MIHLWVSEWMSEWEGDRKREKENMGLPVYYCKRLSYVATTCWKKKKKERKETNKPEKCLPKNENVYEWE